VSARRLLLGGAALLGLLAFSLLAALWTGAEPVSPGDAGETAQAILWDLRLPRAVLAAIVGAALAVAGASLQAVLKNPLADPFVLGVSGGAALGGTLAIAAARTAALTGPFSFLGAVGAGLLVFALGRAGGRLVPERTILVGVVLNAFVSAAITAMIALLSPERTQALLFWLMGTLGYETWGTLAGAGAWVALGALGLFLLSARLNLLLLGDEGAASLGVNVDRTRALALAFSALVIAAAVSLSGLVGFVGLVVPHLVRLFLGPDLRALVPASALAGASFLVLADLAARVSFRALASEPPVGAVTALVGGPFFLWLLWRRAREAT
jgi:iron complex transport system permease protein